jgi:response regulator RpfG family c-di-GMP phosphodiesterase
LPLAQGFCSSGEGEAVLAILETGVKLLEARDPHTAHHSERVAAIALEIGWETGLSPALLESLEVGARLHDVGKVSVPDALLGKEGGAQPRGVGEGARALAPIASLLGKEAVEIARHHHGPGGGAGPG